MRNCHICAFNGAAAEITVPLPFTPRHVEMYRANGGHIEHGLKTHMMSGSAYLSTSTGVDAGVTINSDHSLTIANGADINGAGVVTHVVAWE